MKKNNLLLFCSLLTICLLSSCTPAPIDSQSQSDYPHVDYEDAHFTSYQDFLQWKESEELTLPTNFVPYEALTSIGNFDQMVIPEWIFLKYTSMQNSLEAERINYRERYIYYLIVEDDVTVRMQFSKCRKEETLSTILNQTPSNTNEIPGCSSDEHCLVYNDIMYNYRYDDGCLEQIAFMYDDLCVQISLADNYNVAFSHCQFPEDHIVTYLLQGDLEQAISCIQLEE
jgi:hypothetical protein